MQEEKPRFRHELKYLINRGDQALLRQRLAAVMGPDPHAVQGIYKIRSLYFDDYWQSAYAEKRMGSTGRRKYRIRIYNDSDRLIRLECKRKEEQVVSKRSASLSREECDRIRAGEYAFLLRREETLCREFYYQLHSRLLRPRVIVDYEREPYVWEAGDVRVTFDTDVRACSGWGELFDPRLPMTYVLEPGKRVLEVKFTEFLPGVIRRLLPGRAQELAAVSKYALCCEATEHLYAVSINY